MVSSFQPGTTFRKHLGEIYFYISNICSGLFRVLFILILYTFGFRLYLHIMLKPSLSFIYLYLPLTAFCTISTLLDRPWVSGYQNNWLPECITVNTWVQGSATRALKVRNKCLVAKVHFKNKDRLPFVAFVCYCRVF